MTIGDGSTVESLRSHAVPAWFDDAKLGIFVHWGLYSVPGWAPTGRSLTDVVGEVAEDVDVSDPESFARLERTVEERLGGPPFAFNPYAEWYRNTMAIDDSPTARHHAEAWGNRPYESFAEDFTSGIADWDPGAWADLFGRTGARYVVLTTKHHDGYLLWPSRHRNPHRAGWQSERDLVGELATAVDDAGVRMGLYYSGGLDWTFGGCPIRKLSELVPAIPQSVNYAHYADAHWRELIERYEPWILWNDIGYPRVADHLQLFADYYERCPEGLINDRFAGLTARTDVPDDVHWDFRTPEYRTFADTTDYKWESTRGIGRSFGYNSQETDEPLLSTTELVHLLVDVVSKNGNLLLNVGPTGTGTIPELQAARLEELGTWLDRNGEAIFETRPWMVAEADTSSGTGVRFTARRDALYATVLGGAEAGPVDIRSVQLRDNARVHLLNGRDVRWQRTDEGGTRIHVEAPLSGPAYVLRIEPVGAAEPLPARPDRTRGADR